MEFHISRSQQEIALGEEPVRCIRTIFPKSFHRFLISARLQNEFPNAISLYAPTAVELMKPKWG
jgi:hypothetical protein